MASHFLQHQAMVPKTIQLPDQDSLLKKLTIINQDLQLGKQTQQHNFLHLSSEQITHTNP